MKKLIAIGLISVAFLLVAAFITEYIVIFLAGVGSITVGENIYELFT